MTDRGKGGSQRQGAGGGRSAPPAKPVVDPAVLRRIITDSGAAKEMVETADELGRRLKEEGLGTSQIRALFTEVRRIQADWRHRPEQAPRRLILLKPKMKYRVGRQTGKNKQPVETLVGVLDPAVDLVAGDAANFRRFAEFFEAILAYHKAYGGGNTPGRRS